VLDWSHVEERLGLVSQAALGIDSSAAHRWTEARLDKLWQGKPHAVLSALRHLKPKAGFVEHDLGDFFGDITDLRCIKVSVFSIA
jgi:hypothetical protein